LMKEIAFVVDKENSCDCLSWLFRPYFSHVRSP
jgi:hypothetical protein